MTGLLKDPNKVPDDGNRQPKTVTLIGVQQSESLDTTLALESTKIGWDGDSAYSDMDTKVFESNTVLTIIKLLDQSCAWMERGCQVPSRSDSLVYPTDDKEDENNDGIVVADEDEAMDDAHDDEEEKVTDASFEDNAASEDDMNKNISNSASWQDSLVFETCSDERNDAPSFEPNDEQEAERQASIEDELEDNSTFDDESVEREWTQQEQRERRQKNDELGGENSMIDESVERVLMQEEPILRQALSRELECSISEDTSLPYVEEDMVSQPELSPGGEEPGLAVDKSNRVRNNDNRNEDQVDRREEITDEFNEVVKPHHDQVSNNDQEGGNQPDSIDLENYIRSLMGEWERWHASQMKESIGRRKKKYLEKRSKEESDTVQQVPNDRAADDVKRGVVFVEASERLVSETTTAHAKAISFSPSSSREQDSEGSDSGDRHVNLEQDSETEDGVFYTKKDRSVIELASSGSQGNDKEGVRLEQETEGNISDIEQGVLGFINDTISLQEPSDRSESLGLADLKLLLTPKHEDDIDPVNDNMYDDQDSAHYDRNEKSKSRRPLDPPEEAKRVSKKERPQLRSRVRKDPEEVRSDNSMTSRSSHSHHVTGYDSRSRRISKGQSESSTMPVQGAKKVGDNIDISLLDSFSEQQKFEALEFTKKLRHRAKQLAKEKKKKLRQMEKSWGTNLAV